MLKQGFWIYFISRLEGVTEEFLSVEVMKLDFQYSRPIYVIIQQIIYGICHV